MHRSTPASFQATAEAYELWKRLTEKEPNTWLPQKYLRTIIGAHRMQNEMWTRVLPRPAKPTQPSSTVGGIAGWCSHPGNSVEALQGDSICNILRTAGERPDFTPKIQMQ